MSASSYFLTNGVVYTMDSRQPWAQCLVVRGNEIVYVGPEAFSASFVDESTEVIDLDEREIHAVPIVLTMMDGRLTHDAR